MLKTLIQMIEIAIENICDIEHWWAYVENGTTIFLQTYSIKWNDFLLINFKIEFLSKFFR